MTLSQILIAIHTLISIAALLAGAPALRDIFRARSSSPSLTVFIVLAIATSATGFLCPLKGVTPAVVVSIVALAILAAVLVAARGVQASRLARWVYAGGLVASEYLLVFVAVAQAFAKIPALKAAAPTQSEPPFLVAQVVVLVAFVAIGLLSLRAFAPGRASAEPSFR